MNTEIVRIGEITDGPIRVGGPTHTKALFVEVGMLGTRDLLVQPLAQDAALELVAKLTLFLKARGCL